MAPPKYSSKRGLVNGSSTQGLVKFSIRAIPLPKPLLEFVLDNSSILKRLQRERKNALGGFTEDDDRNKVDDDDSDRERSQDDSEETFRKPTVRLDQFWTALEKVCKRVGGDWEKGIIDRIWAFGPHRAGGCLLVDARKSVKAPNSYAHPLVPVNRSDLLECSRLRRRFDRAKSVENSPEAFHINRGGATDSELGHDLDHHVETGFQLATFQGPLCSEPVEGMAYFLESLGVESEETKSETGGVSTFNPRYPQNLRGELD